MAAKPELRNLPLTTAGPRPQPLAFTLPPAIKRDRPATLVLPDAPVLEAAVKITGAPDLPLTAPMPRLQPKVFNAPPVRPLTEIAGSSRSGSADMDAPPATENRPLSAPGAIAGLARPFLAPPSAPRIERPPAALPAEAPAAGAASSQTASLASMAIVGLNPANTSVIPAPPAPREGAGLRGRPPSRSSRLLRPARSPFSALREQTRTHSLLANFPCAVRSGQPCQYLAKAVVRNPRKTRARHFCASSTG